MSEIEREEMEVDVLLVGAGPANLACAYHLLELIEKDTAEGGSLGETLVMVIEKGANVGAHVMSGAVLDPISLKELIPDFENTDIPVNTKVTDDDLLFLTKTSRTSLPWVPANMHHPGCYIISLNKLAVWLGTKLEEKGCEVFPGTAGAELLYEDNKVIGVRTDDKGLDKEGNPKSNYEPGMDLKAKITVLGEGTRGSLTKELINKFDLSAGRNPQNYTTAVKELWEFPEGTLKAGEVIHTMGFPLGNSNFGGGFLYNLSDTLMSIGLVIGMNCPDPFIELQALFSKMKLHPHIKQMLEKGKMIRYGAKTIPEGGYWSIPKNYGDGFLIVGDSSSFLNPARLKGIHLAIKSGMLAAETIFETLKKDEFSEGSLKTYDNKWRSSYIHKEMYKYRNFHFMYERGISSAPGFIINEIFKGPRAFKTRHNLEEDYKNMRMLKDHYGDNIPTAESWRPKADSKLTFNKIDSVYYSGTSHEEEQPSHLVVSDTNICATKCIEEYGNPCQYFCPANVYEMEGQNGRKELKINASNCVHCKTCDIADPYGIITWKTPEGGGGPNYDGL